MRLLLSGGNRFGGVCSDQKQLEATSLELRPIPLSCPPTTEEISIWANLSSTAHHHRSSEEAGEVFIHYAMRSMEDFIVD